MITFLCGLALLIIGGMVYGKICEKIIKPSDEKTPAVKFNDGVDYVPMKKWRNSLIQLLNIAGTGPILGPIQGILFGPIAFITIPIGCVLGGAFHDYMSGMIAMRNDGEQMPSLIKRFLGKHIYVIYNTFVCILMLLVGAVFISTPGDLFITQIAKGKADLSNPVLWIVYGMIFVYYIIATLLPIDKIIGKIYPIFGGILLISAVGIFIGLLVKGYPLDEIWNIGCIGVHPKGLHFIPIFFVTVACGIVSGFHSTQSALLSRTVEHEKEGKNCFYNMMICEGFIAMIWAAAAMGVMKLGLASSEELYTLPAKIVGVVSKNLLGTIGGIIAIIGVIVLPITSGDTALRSLRLMVADALHIDQSKRKNRLLVALVIFILVASILLFSKLNANGFNVLWRYFAWANQTIAVFTFAMITVYMMKHHMPYILSLIPGSFYMFIISSFLLNAQIGFNFSWSISYTVAGVLTIAYAAATLICGKKQNKVVSKT